MRITELTVKLGETVNLGDYSNFRPEISATVEIYPGDNVDRSMRILIRTVEEQLADLVDDALERAEKEPKYASPLFGLRVNQPRGVVVVFTKGLKLPEANNWRDKDKWERVDGYSCPMRLDTVMGAAERVEKERGLALHLIEWQEDMDTLPGLPDPGPEPLWSTKGLRHGLEALHIPEDVWEKVGELPHVNVNYLDNFYIWLRDRWTRQVNIEERVNMFLAGATPWNPEAGVTSPNEPQYVPLDYSDLPDPDFDEEE